MLKSTTATPAIKQVGYQIMITLSATFISCSYLSGGAVAQSVERATPGEEVPGSIPAVAAPY